MHQDRSQGTTQGRGYVVNTVQNIQAGTPAENVLAMIKAVRGNGFYDYTKEPNGVY